MSNNDVLKLKDELDSVNSHCKQLARQVDELQKELISKEDYVKQCEAVIKTQSDRIKFLEGQVDAYQYCLNCRR